jgi:F0F1-type ATP synthase membrane subunit c/vacuolar-type H+-ATPase subunit K
MKNRLAIAGAVLIVLAAASLGIMQGVMAKKGTHFKLAMTTAVVTQR